MEMPFYRLAAFRQNVSIEERIKLQELLDSYNYMAMNPPDLMYCNNLELIVYELELTKLKLELKDKIS